MKYLTIMGGVAGVFGLWLWLSPWGKLLRLGLEISGRGGWREYLVLLQNNMELRPTGGFLGSYARIKLASGRLEEVKVQDIYTPDGQLPGYVVPPAPIYKYLNSSGWFLRDSNWEADFTKAAPVIEWFFSHGKEPEADGIVAINLNVVKGWLAVVGPVYLADYQETITDENLFDKAQSHSEVDFFPGSTQKQDFLSQLASQLLEKTKASNWRTRWKLTQEIYGRLRARDILIWLKPEGWQEVMSQLGWDGAMKLPTCPKNRNCLTDYLMIVEANLGVNKTNCCLNRKIKHQVTISQTGIQETVTINYKNNNPATPEAPKFWGGGYKNYLRVYVPQKSQLEQVEIDNQPLQLTEVDTAVENEFLVMGLLVEVGGGDQKSVEISYSQAVEETGGKGKKIYLLKSQRQSGTSDDPYELTVVTSGCTKRGWSNLWQQDLIWSVPVECD